jgi:AraC-like DNA-binding protein
MIKYLNSEQNEVLTAPVPGFLSDCDPQADEPSLRNGQYLANRASSEFGFGSSIGNTTISNRDSLIVENHHPASDSVDTNAAQKVRQSIVYMRQRLNRPLQVAVLAASVNISQSHYFAIFKRFTGSTPIDYFIQLRMQQACQLLKTTSASVKEVAGSLGYDDPFYFSRVFRSVHGVAPSEYRVLNRALHASTPGFRRADRSEHNAASPGASQPGRLVMSRKEDSP